MKCRICKSNKNYEVFNLKKQPLANKYPKNRKEIIKEKKYKLSVYFCEECKTAQIKNIISRKLMFKEYFYLSSINKGLRDHFIKLATKLKKFNLASSLLFDLIRLKIFLIFVLVLFLVLLFYIHHK